MVWCVILLTAGVGTLSMPALANAQSGIDDTAIEQQCQVQYPGGNGYEKGSHYLAAPGDPYSWRCRQRGTSTSSGVFTDLAVDLGAICASRGEGPPQPPNNGDPRGWTCA